MLISAFAPGAWSQTEPPDREDGQQPADDAIEQGVEEIVVTGSRIRRTSVFETVTPTIAVSDTELEKQGFTNLINALNELPGFVPTRSPVGAQNNLSVGVSYANLYGLGSQRTLTLVDGKRFVSSNPPQIQGLPGGSQVDLNLIPLGLIDRVDVVGVGGAPTYGSDAIAGTVNIIIKKHFEGLELTGQYDTIQENSGEPASYMLRGLWGANTADDRGNVALAVEYTRDEGVLVDAFPRFFAAQPSFEEIPNVRDVDGDGVLDDVNQIFYDIRIPVQTGDRGAVLTPTGIFLPFGPPFGISQEEADQLSMFPGSDVLLQITEEGELTRFDPGIGVPSDPFSAVGGDGLDRSLRNQLLSPVTRVISMATAHYQIGPGIELYGQANMANSEARTLADQDALNIFPFGDEQAALAFSIDTPFLSAEERQRLIDVGAGDTFFAGVATEGVVDNGRAQTETFLWRLVGGLRGDFEIGDRQWSWDLSANYGETSVVSSDTGFNDGRFFNAIDAIRLTDEDIQSVIEGNETISTVDEAFAEINRLSGTATVSSGDVICRAVLKAARGDIPLRQSTAGGAANDVLPNVEGCIPLNVLGRPSPQEAIEWAQREQITRGDLQQRVFSFSLSGELFELPAGWIQGVGGYETRREGGRFQSDEATQIGIGRNSPILDTEGEFSTDAAFFELLAPIVSPDMEIGADVFGFSLIDSLSLEGSARSLDNSVTGRGTVWTAGARFRLGGALDDLMIRGNVTESTRSPSIQELFSPRVETFSFSDDPCDRRFRTQGPVPENRQANCEAEGLPLDFSSLVVRAARQGVTGGNPNLSDETANAWTAGLVYTPDWITGLTISADYISIIINDRITQLTLEDQMQACYDQDPATFDPNAGVCASFQRNVQGQISGFATGFQNAAASTFKGIQAQGLYQFDLADALGIINESWGETNRGHVTISARAFHRITNEFSVIGEVPEGEVGGFDEPSWSGLVDLTWSSGPGRLFWRLEWQGSAKLDPNGDEFFEDVNGQLVDETDARFINDLGFSYNFSDIAVGQITIENVFDREASDLEIAAGHYGLDEIFGRVFRFRVTARFE